MQVQTDLGENVWAQERLYKDMLEPETANLGRVRASARKGARAQGRKAESRGV